MQYVHWGPPSGMCIVQYKPLNWCIHIDLASVGLHIVEKPHSIRKQLNGIFRYRGLMQYVQNQL